MNFLNVEVKNENLSLILQSLDIYIQGPALFNRALLLIIITQCQYLALPITPVIA